MSRFGWAYVNDVITGSGGGTPGGSNTQIQYNNGGVFDGSPNLTFDYNTNTVRLTGTLYADNLIVSSSTIYKSGSTKFGDDAGDTHQFTGSILSQNSLTVNGATNLNNNLTVVGQISSSVSILTAGSITAGSNITSNSSISASSGLNTAGTITAVSHITSTGGIISSSVGLATAGYVNAGSNITTLGSISSSAGLTLGGGISAAGNIVAGASLSSSVGITTGGQIVTSGGLTATGSITTLGTYTGDGSNITGIQGYNVNGVGDDWTIQFKDGNTGTLTGSSALTFSGSTLTLTGSFLMTGSSTFINIGPTILSGNLNVTGAITGNNAFISGGLSVGNYVQMLPVGSVIIPTNQTASYIYTSGSTNDLYFTQYQPGTNFTNTTRLRWLEGGLTTGLLHGGLLSTVTGTTSFNVSSGSGIVLTYNASTTSDPYPTIKQVTWSNFVSQSLIYSSSAQITYVAIDEFGAISQTNSAFTPEQFKDRIILGRILHQSGAVTNGVTATPSTAYGINSNTQDFFRAFGPLKVGGQVLAASGTTTLAITRTAGDSYVEGRNYSTNPNIPNYVSAVDDPALTTTKIFYSWVSGSTSNIDINGGAGYTALIPNKYNLNGTVTTITPTPNKFTIQRIYWFPKSVNRALFAYYGSTIYATLLEAIDGVTSENNFTEGDNTKGSAVYLGAVIMEAGITNFTDTTKSKIINGGLFRATANGGGGGGAVATPGGSTHQIQFNDSGVFNGSPNLTFDTTTLRLTGSFSMLGTGSLDIDGGYITGSGRASFGIISGSTVTGSTALFTTITGSIVTSSIGQFTQLTSSNLTIVSGTINSRGIPNVLPTSIRRTIQVFPGAGSMVNSMNPINNTNDTPFTQGGTPTQGFVNGSAAIAYSVVSSTSTYGITTPDVGSTKVLCTSQRGPSWRGTFRTGNDLTLTRIFAGFEEYAGDKSSDDPTNGYAHLSYSSARGDTTFKMITRTANGVGTQTLLDTGIAASTSTNYYFDMTLSSGSYNVTLVSGSSTFVGSITSSLPNITASLGTCCAAKNTAAVSRNLSIYFLEFNDS